MSSKKRTAVVTASQLAEMGVCERRVLLAARCGKRRSAEQADAGKLGDAKHAAFFQDAVRVNPALLSSQTKPWCFVATLAFGAAASETMALRAFRDQVLRRTWCGRQIIRLYYRHSPALCRFLTGRPRALAIARSTLLPIVAIARRRVGNPVGPYGSPR